MTEDEARGWVDWLLVLGVALVVGAGLGLENPWRGSRLDLALVAVALALPLVVRRTRPLLTVALVAGAVIVQDLLGDSLGFGSFLAALVAAYSLGRHALRRHVVALGLVLLFAGMAAAMAEQIAATPAEVFFPVVYTSAAVGLGRVVRALSGRAAELERYNEALTRDRETSARLAVAAERMRLARELHDVLAHTVMVMVWQAEEAESVLQSPGGTDRERALACLRNVQEAGRTGLAELRSLVTVLRDDEAVDLPAPRLDGLTHLAALMSGSGLDVDLVLELPDDHGVPDEQQAAVYRVVQESLTNVLRHSHADRVRVHVTADGERLRCSVTDPGPRRDEPRPGSGHGLSGMQERLEVLGGQVTAGREGDGFQVEVVLPLAAVVS